MGPWVLFFWGPAAYPRFRYFLGSDFFLEWQGIRHEELNNEGGSPGSIVFALWQAGAGALYR